MLIYFIITLTFIITICYLRLTRKYKYWMNKGIKQGSPVLILGDKWGSATHIQSLPDMVQMVYDIGDSNERYCGAYDFMSPALVLKDPELIKDITVKDFDHFVDHKRVIPEDSDPIWDKNLFFLTGEKWRDMRSTLSPAFTGAKMKHLYGVITKNAEQFVNHFLKRNENLITIEMKDTFTRFTNDTIANAVFGFECDSLEDRESQFYIMAKNITDFSGIWQTIKILGFFIVPKLYKIFKIRILSSEIANFFYNIVKENIRSRKEKKIIRPDMINLLMEARENQKLIRGIEITDEDITAQALVFFFAGFDSVSSLMCFMSYELAVNPEIQEKLKEEIDKTAESCDDQLTYETVKDMKYMDMVVSETLRKYPITPFVNRICTKPYTIEAKKPEEKPVHLKENDIVFLPIYALHRDPKYFPDPERFDPERFNEENKSKIVPYTYIPFGSGPRKCIGYRFALLEIKILFFYILTNFEIIPVEKTQIPLKISKKSLNMTPDGGLWFGLKRR